VVSAHRVMKHVIHLVLSRSANYGSLSQRTRVTTRLGCAIFGDEQVHKAALELGG
jgi:hypothetical protein